MVHNNDDAMNKIPLKSASGLDDEEKNAGEFIQDTAAAEEARREQMRANLLKWMKKLTIVLICFIGIALISYVIISLCFSDWPKSTYNTTTTPPTPISNSTATATAIASASAPLQLPTTTLTTTTATTSASSSSTSSKSSLLADDGKENAKTAFTSTGSNSSTSDNILLIANETMGTKATTTATTSALEDSSETLSPATAANTADTEPTTGSDPDSALLQDSISIDPTFNSKLGVYEKAAVCSDREVCSRIGSNILKDGGSAVDAAIATLLCNGVVNMHSMGIGGGMLMNVYIKEDQRAYSIDAREVAPFAAHQDMFEGKLITSLNGGQSIAVPGEVMGYHRAHERFGKLPWKSLVQPSIQLCNDGYVLSEHQHEALKYKLPHLKNNTVLTNTFLNPTNDELLSIGTKVKPPKELCETYKLLAENGPMDFYNGTLAKLIVDDLKELGSSITTYDLESYVADMVSSITMQLGNDVLHAMPPISSGVVVANVLSILEGFNFTKADLMGTVTKKATTIHRFVEALKFGFAKRWELGDVRFNDVRELVSKLTNPEYGIQMRELINDTSVLNDIYEYGAEFMGTDDMGTSHVSLVAPNGDAVSVTSSVNDYFGSSQAGKRTGIVFNSGMNDFSIPGTKNLFNLPPASSNFIDARKRAMSSMSPMLLTDEKGDLRMAIGAAGGTQIIGAVVEVMARVLWFGQNIKEAIDAPRFHHQLLPNELLYQNGGFSEEVLKLLQAKGHTVKPFMTKGSVTCGIVRNGTAIYANADYRKRGGTAGF